MQLRYVITYDFIRHKGIFRKKISSKLFYQVTIVADRQSEARDAFLRYSKPFIKRGVKVRILMIEVR